MTVTAEDAVRAVETLVRSPNDRYVEALRAGDRLFAEHEITTPLRMAHFLAQALHETGSFRVIRESMNYSEERLFEIFGVNRHSAAVTREEARQLARNREAIAERVYGLGNPRKARELGNTEPGDGFRYRGNGVLQTTGRANHRTMGRACGVDFEGDPSLVTAPEHALKPALHEWTRSRLNELADKNKLDAITRKINGGFNGLADRRKKYEQLWPLLKGPDDPEDPWSAGESDNQVERLQRDLNALGASPPLEVDGIIGSDTRRAVRAFQRAAGLDDDGIAGPITLAAIRLALERLR